MGLGRRVYREEHDERERAITELRTKINAVPAARLMALFPHGDVKSVPPPEALDITWALLWRALGRPRALSPEDGSMAPDCTDEERKDVERRMKRVIRPLLDRLEVIDSRRRN